MLLTKPPWVHHSGGAIYSVDIHPSGEKLVTCGQGDEGGSGLVIVWNLLPVTNEALSTDANVHKLLARMLHMYCVNCVRWSPCNGEYLACAGDDQVVTIWQFAGRVNSAGTIGSTTVNVEQYRCVYKLHGHSLDVLHVEWSRDGAMLATCAMDNTVIVWNASKFPEKIVVLDSTRDGHSDVVKGVSWDPIGRYLASQAADRTVKIWGTSTWQCVKTLRKPFEESSQTTMFSRLDWSPDGAYLLLPAAMNNGGPTVQIVARNRDWSCDLDLVGHSRAVTAVVGSNRIGICMTTGRTIHVACFAVGSRDKSVSIWLLPRVPRPVVVVKNLFKHSVLDFSWCGMHLIACSMDGSIDSIQFTERELGRMLNLDEMARECEKLYGKCPAIYKSPQRSKGGMNGHVADAGQAKAIEIIDDVEVLRQQRVNEQRRMREEKEATATRLSDNAPAASFASTPSCDKPATSSNATPTKQTETRTKDGKRRIQPIFLGSTIAPIAAVTTTTSTVNAEEGELATSKSIVQQASQPIAVTSAGSAKKKNASEEPSKKRKTFVASDSDEDTSIVKRRKGSHIEENRMESSTGDDVGTGPAERPRPVLRPIPPPMLCMAETRDESDERGVYSVFPVPVQQLQLIATIVHKHANSPLPDSIRVQNDFTLPGTSSTASTDKRRVTRITAGRDTHTVWTTMLDPSVAVLSANEIFVVCGCFSHDVIVYAVDYGRCVRRVHLDSCPALITQNHAFVLAITVAGFVYCWDFRVNRVIVSRRSLVDIIEHDARLVNAIVTDGGVPCFTMSNGRAFAYSREIDSWELLSDNTSLLLALADSCVSSSSRLAMPDTVETGPVTRLFTAPQLRGRRPITTTGEMREICTQSLLEQQLLAARALGSGPGEYRQFIHEYVQRLVADGCVGKLESVLVEMIPSAESSQVCGLWRRPLVNELCEYLDGQPSCAAVAKLVRSRMEEQ